MKKLLNTVSPFVMLLVPVFLAILLLHTKPGRNNSREPKSTAIYKIPRLETIFSSVF